jgi:hypothetical protein
MRPDFAQSIDRSRPRGLLTANPLRSGSLQYRYTDTDETITVPNIWYNQTVESNVSRIRYDATCHEYASGNPRLSCWGLIGQSSLQVTDREVTDERDTAIAVEAARGYSGVVGRACEGPAGFRAESGGLLQGPRPRSEVLYPLET